MRRCDPWSPRQQWHLSALAELVVDIQHHSGELNIVADTLSRAPLLAAIFLGINSNDISRAHPDCPELEALLEHPSDSSSLFLQKCTLHEGKPAL